MSKLNNDMQQALSNLGLNSEDEKLLEQILYLERINKTKEWTTDAVKQIRELIDDHGQGESND